MAANQAPLSLGFSRQEYQSELPCPPPGDLPDPGMKPTSPAWQADSLPLSHLGSLHVTDFIAKGVMEPTMPPTGLSGPSLLPHPICPYWIKLGTPTGKFLCLEAASPCRPPGDLPDPGIEPESPAWQADSLPLAPPGKPK